MFKQKILKKVANRQVKIIGKMRKTKEKSHSDRKSRKASHVAGEIKVYDKPLSPAHRADGQ